MDGARFAILLALPLTAQESRGERPPLPTPEAIRELPADGGPEFNRLVFEKSPYLLQHARNPVDWYPWGDEAFVRAKEEDKPVFLSVGYATCHWCHVMEHESFEDEEVAKLLNEGFVCVKVDREERPDVDQVYMAVTQAMTGSGGWPMTVFMTPDKKPFFAGTYFPKSERFGRPGLIELLPRILDAWRTRREELTGQADRVAAWLAQRVAPQPGEALEATVLEVASKELAARYDAAEGGFGSEPKFPIPHQIRFLLRRYARAEDEDALAMAEGTLRAMARGGIRDQLGGGFHRYSTDRRWLVPHFEKMLYDQALLALAYVEAFEVTRREEHREVAESIFAYVLRDLAAPGGAFCSAEDADSEGEEGRFYLWTRAELDEVLGEEDGAFAADVFGVTAGGNLPEAPGRNVLSLANPARISGLGARERFASVKHRLLAARSLRPRPLLDDKVLTDWNGLMIAALARGARALDRPDLAVAARRAAAFVLEQLRDDSGRLRKRWRLGEAAHDAVLEDHAFLALGLIELYETDFDPRWLREAVRTVEAMDERFRDEEHGGYYLTADDSEALLARPREAYDGAIPSGNSVAALDLLRLGHLTGRVELLERAGEVLRSFSGEVRGRPSGFCQMGIALDLALGPASEIVIVGEPGSDGVEAMLREVRSRFLPGAVVILRPPGDEPAIAALAPFVRELGMREGRATAYVCREFACRAPVTSAEELGALLDE